MKQKLITYCRKAFLKSIKHFLTFVAEKQIEKIIKRIINKKKRTLEEQQDLLLETENLTMIKESVK